MSIKTWKEREADPDWVPATQEVAMQDEINELRAELELARIKTYLVSISDIAIERDALKVELAKLKQQKPIAHLKIWGEDQVKDSQECPVYLAAGVQQVPEKAIAKIIGVGPDYRPCEHETDEYRDEVGVCVEYADGYRDCFYVSDLFVKSAQPVQAPEELSDGEIYSRVSKMMEARSAVPDGCQIAPITPDSRMYGAGAKALYEHAKLLKLSGRSTDMMHTSDEALCRKIYKAMLEAVKAKP